MVVTAEGQAAQAVGMLSDAELDQARGGFLLQEAMAGMKLMGEMLSNVSKTRSEISMTFARNARA